MSARTIPVKLKPKGAELLPVQLFFQAGDWAVTQGICVFHSNQCFRLTHLPSTRCIPVCINVEGHARQLARQLNQELPKFRENAKPEIVEQFSRIITDFHTREHLPLILSPRP